MNIVCVICSDLLVPSDDVFHTPCGHIFHFVCLSQWLERSKTCPQCRDKTTSHKISRIYFNFSNSDSIVEDTCSLQDKVDKLTFQLMLREKDVKHFTEKSQKLEKQTKDLRKEVTKVESELNEKASAIYALKEQIKYFREQNVEMENRNKEIEQIRKKIENYKNIQTLLEAATEDVDEMISRSSDPNTLITYISVMKREMTISLNKRRELRTKVKSLQQELTKVSMERNFLSEEHTRRKKLEEDLMTCESEKMFLQNKLRELEKNMSLMQKSSNSISKTVDRPNRDSNPGNYSKQDKVESETENAVSNTKTAKEDVHKRKDSQPIATKSETNSPYLPVKTTGVFSLKHTTTQKNTMKLTCSILAKKPRIEVAGRNERQETNKISYDGFGGHSKLEQFPSSSSLKTKKPKDDGTKPKRPKLDTDNNQKFSLLQIKNNIVYL